MDRGAAADRDLVQHYLARADEVAFLALYRRHTPGLFGLAARLAGGDHGLAEEIVQEAWVRAAEGFASFRWESSLRTWLSGIVVNGWREIARARRHDPFCANESDAVEPEPREPDQIDLERAVAQLPDGFRTVLVLHDVEGFTHEEIGRLLRIEAGTSKSQLARARQALRRRLRAWPAGEEQGEPNEGRR
jgi:RNA polymerase sigma-70 factor (ECF subfamily)